MTELTAITRLGRDIGSLREYRTRLLADIVTGKLEARAAASAESSGLTEEGLAD